MILLFSWWDMLVFSSVTLSTNQIEIWIELSHPNFRHTQITTNKSWVFTKKISWIFEGHLAFPCFPLHFKKAAGAAMANALPALQERLCTEVPYVRSRSHHTGFRWVFVDLLKKNTRKFSGGFVTKNNIMGNLKHFCLMREGSCKHPPFFLGWVGGCFMTSSLQGGLEWWYVLKTLFLVSFRDTFFAQKGVIFTSEN